MHLSRIAVFLIMILASLTSHATTYWVSTTGNNSNTCTTQTTGECASIQKAISLAQPGDTIYIKAGTYSEISAASAYTTACMFFAEGPASWCIKRNGTKANPIVISSAPGVADGTVILDSQNVRVGVQVNGFDYITFQGLKFINNLKYAIVNDAPDSGSTHTVNNSSISIGVLIQNCIVDGVTTPDFGDNIGAIGPWGSQDWIIRNNLLNNVVGGSGIRAYGEINVRVEHNTITNVDEGIMWKDHFVKNDTTRGFYQESEIAYNYISARIFGINIQTRGTGSAEAGHNYIHHNIFTGFTQSEPECFHYLMTDANRPSGNVKFVNNLLPSTSYSFRYKTISIGGSASSYATLGTVTTPAATRTFHVSKTGSDTNNGLTTDTAFITVNKFHSVAAAGDICYVHTGTYIEDTVASTYVADQVYLDAIFCSQACIATGTTTNPIVLRAWPADEGSVYFDNRGDTLSDSTARAGIYLAPNKNNWHFYGFKFINGWTTFIGSLGTGAGVGAGVTNANFSSKCVIENCSFKGLRGTPGVNCAAISPLMSKDWIVRNCFIDDLLLSASNWGYGIQTYGQSNILIEHVTTTNNVAWGIYFKDHVARGFMGSTREGTIQFNRLLGNRGGVLVGINQTDSNAASTNYIQHNIVKASIANFAGIFVEMAGAGGRSEPQYITQNTIDMQNASAPAISLDSGDAYLNSNIYVRSGTDLQTVGYGENKASHGNAGTRIKSMDYNVYESAFFAGLDDYVSTVAYVNGLPAWKAATTATAHSLAFNNPDTHAVIGTLSALFNDTIDYTNKVGSPALAINADSSNAGAYRFGGEILGTLPSYTAGV